MLKNVLPGLHTVYVTGRNTEASFSFELDHAKVPSITGTVLARNILAVLVASFMNKARVVTNAGPWKVRVNGYPDNDAGPAGVDLKNFQPGVNELVLAQGNDQRSMKESFGPEPMLTAFLKTDRNAGTLIVSAGEDNVRVFLNNKEYPRRTRDGQLRIQTVGPVSVRVLKDGFKRLPVQTADVRKGTEVRLEFNMKAK